MTQNYAIYRDDSLSEDMSDNELAMLADTVFRQGLKDGRTRHRRTRDAVMLLIPVNPCRVIHTRKLRQIYEAGYDITRTILEARARGR